MCFVSSEMFYFVSGLLLRIALPGGQARPYMGLQQKCLIVNRFYTTFKPCHGEGGKGSEAKDAFPPSSRAPTPFWPAF